jgi:L-serine dehydratase
VKYTGLAMGRPAAIPWALQKLPQAFLGENKNATRFRVLLYGSLSATGKGHLTDYTIDEIFKNHQLETIWKPEIFLPFHPNALKFEAFDESGKLIAERTSYSVGGGAVVNEGEASTENQVYGLSTLGDILKWSHSNGKQLWEFVEENEGEGIWEFLAEIWEAMDSCIKNGLAGEGVLPGGLRLPRKAAVFKTKAAKFNGPFKKTVLFICVCPGCFRSKRVRVKDCNCTNLRGIWCASCSAEISPESL